MKNKLDFQVLDFSGAYDDETFYIRKKGRKISFRDVAGTDCYCAREAQKEIAWRLEKENVPVRGLHFIDSGNYHYLSHFFLSRIQKPFALALPDHHPDTQEPGLLSLLSCASWVRWSLLQLPLLQKVYIIGMNPELSKELPGVFREKIVTIYKGETSPERRLEEEMKKESLPVYISLDKDVLGPDAAPVNWDQGDMTKEALQTLLRTLKRHAPEVLGMDVCGEHHASPSNPERLLQAARNDSFNEEILEWVKNMEIF